MIYGSNNIQLEFSFNRSEKGQHLFQAKTGSLQNLDPSASLSEELKGVADQFEAIFLETLLKQARESKLNDGLFESKADDNFEQMFDQELANSTSKLVDIGIADAIVRQMSKS